MADVLKLQSQVARAVADEIRLRLRRVNGRNWPRRVASNPRLTRRISSAAIIAKNRTKRFSGRRSGTMNAPLRLIRTMPPRGLGCHAPGDCAASGERNNSVKSRCLAAAPPLRRLSWTRTWQVRTSNCSMSNSPLRVTGRDRSEKSNARWSLIRAAVTLITLTRTC